MNSKKENSSLPNTLKTDKPTAPGRGKKSPPRNLSATDKAQAVLAVWTEKCKPAEACRQMGVSWIVFNQWQTRAMEGMLQALESRVNLSQGGALSPRLQALMEKRQRALGVSRLSQKLDQWQQRMKAPQSPPEKA